MGLATIGKNGRSFAHNNPAFSSIFRAKGDGFDSPDDQRRTVLSETPIATATSSYLPSKEKAPSPAGALPTTAGSLRWSPGGPGASRPSSPLPRFNWARYSLLNDMCQLYDKCPPSVKTSVGHTSDICPQILRLKPVRGIPLSPDPHLPRGTPPGGGGSLALAPVCAGFGLYQSPSIPGL